jgi:DNA-binding response OmpR family regulator
MSSRPEDETSRVPPAAAQNAAMSHADTLQPDKVVTVLCISAHDSDHHSLGHLFSHTKWTLLEARSREEAVRLLRARPVPVVVCDCGLPDGGWKDVIEEAAGLPHPPVVIVTSRLADDSLWSEVMNLGGYDVLEKPFNHSELVRVVSLAWLAWKDQRRRAAAERTHLANNF